MMNCIDDEYPNSKPKDILSSLPNGERVCKADERFEACGTIDELNSFLGLLITEVPEELNHELFVIQRFLFAVGAFTVGVPQPDGLPKSSDICVLRERIDFFKHEIGEIHHFVLPGGSHSAALAHVCRTICRRAERNVVRIAAYPVVPYLNRLSTYFFYLALYLNKINDCVEKKL